MTSVSENIVLYSYCRLLVSYLESEESEDKNDYCVESSRRGGDFEVLIVQFGQ